MFLKSIDAGAQRHKVEFIAKTIFNVVLGTHLTSEKTICNACGMGHYMDKRSMDTLLWVRRSCAKFVGWRHAKNRHCF